jgi:hypothetical protein
MESRHGKGFLPYLPQLAFHIIAFGAGTPQIFGPLFYLLGKEIPLAVFDGFALVAAENDVPLTGHVADDGGSHKGYYDYDENGHGKPVDKGMMNTAFGRFIFFAFRLGGYGFCFHKYTISFLYVLFDYKEHEKNITDASLLSRAAAQQPAILHADA